MRQLLRHLLPAAILAAGSILRADSAAPELRVTVRNDLPLARSSETVEIPASSLAALGGDLARVHVFDHDSNREVLAQALDLDGDGTAESLIFQTDMPARGVRSFDLRAGDRVTYRKDDFHVYGRFVRERYDDFAWENDRVAHRTYGEASFS